MPITSFTVLPLFLDDKHPLRGREPIDRQAGESQVRAVFAAFAANAGRALWGDLRPTGKSAGSDLCWAAARSRDLMASP